MELTLRAYTPTLSVPDDTAYIELVADILESPSFLSMEQYIQHGTTNCRDHSIAVSYLSYLACLEYGLDAKSVARAGLLHDMFLYDWHEKNEKRRGLHGFTHPRIALENATREFELNDIEKDCILRHMWPLTLVPPRHKEGFVLLYYDKICSTRETLGKAIF